MLTCEGGKMKTTDRAMKIIAGAPATGPGIVHAMNLDNPSLDDVASLVQAGFLPVWITPVGMVVQGKKDDPAKGCTIGEGWAEEKAREWLRGTDYPAVAKPGGPPLVCIIHGITGISLLQPLLDGQETYNCPNCGAPHDSDRAVYDQICRTHAGLFPRGGVEGNRQERPEPMAGRGEAGPLAEGATRFSYETRSLTKEERAQQQALARKKETQEWQQRVLEQGRVIAREYREFPAVKGAIWIAADCPDGGIVAALTCQDCGMVLALVQVADGEMAWTD
jgi:hypothetical protein